MLPEVMRLRQELRTGEASGFPHAVAAVGLAMGGRPAGSALWEVPRAGSDRGLSRPIVREKLMDGAPHTVREVELTPAMRDLLAGRRQ